MTRIIRGRKTSLNEANNTYPKLSVSNSGFEVLYEEPLSIPENNVLVESPSEFPEGVSLLVIKTKYGTKVMKVYNTEGDVPVLLDFWASRTGSGQDGQYFYNNSVPTAGTASLSEHWNDGGLLYWTEYSLDMVDFGDFYAVGPLEYFAEDEGAGYVKVGKNGVTGWRPTYVAATGVSDSLKSTVCSVNLGGSVSILHGSTPTLLYADLVNEAQADPYPVVQGGEYYYAICELPNSRFALVPGEDSATALIYEIVNGEIEYVSSHAWRAATSTQFPGPSHHYFYHDLETLYFVEIDDTDLRLTAIDLEDYSLKWTANLGEWENNSEKQYGAILPNGNWVSGRIVNTVDFEVVERSKDTGAVLRTHIISAPAGWVAKSKFKVSSTGLLYVFVSDTRIYSVDLEEDSSQVYYSATSPDEIFFNALPVIDAEDKLYFTDWGWNIVMVDGVTTKKIAPTTGFDSNSGGMLSLADGAIFFVTWETALGDPDSVRLFKVVFNE
jgi:hypothetical protein